MRTYRNGFTLVEVLVTTALLGTCCTIAGMCLQTLMQTDRNIRNDWQFANILAQFELQLRRDAHAASSVETTELTATFQLPAGTQVFYTVEPLSITRVAKRNGEIQHTEIYQIPDDAHVIWRLPTHDNASFLELEIQRESSAQVRRANRGHESTPQELRWAKWLLRIGTNSVTAVKESQKP